MKEDLLDLNKIQFIAQSHSAQELFAALVWQRQFNQFDGIEVITDLFQHPQLWSSFLFTKPIFAPDEYNLSFTGVIDTLTAMANYYPMPETSMIHFISYPADTLYILTENQDTIVSQLLYFGKKWQADSVEISDEKNEFYGWRLKNCLRNRSEKSIFEQLGSKACNAVVIAYWWD